MANPYRTHPISSVIIALGTFILLRGKSSGGGTSLPNYRDYSTAVQIDLAKTMNEIRGYPRQFWLIVDPQIAPQISKVSIAELLTMTRKVMISSAKARPNLGFAIVNCHLFDPYEGPNTCENRRWTWQVRDNYGSVLDNGGMQTFTAAMKEFLING